MSANWEREEAKVKDLVKNFLEELNNIQKKISKESNDEKKQEYIQIYRNK